MDLLKSMFCKWATPCAAHGTFSELAASWSRTRILIRRLALPHDDLPRSYGASAYPKARQNLAVSAYVDRRRDRYDRTILASDESMRPFERSKIGPVLDRRAFLIGAGVAAGQGFPVSAMAQSTTLPSLLYGRVDAYSHFSSLKFLDFAERQADRPFVLRSMYERLTTLQIGANGSGFSIRTKLTYTC